MAIIDYTIFKNHLNLVIDDKYVKDGINQAIDEYEGEYLMKALGRTFGQLFVNGLGVTVGGGFSDGFSDGFDIGGIEERWLWLRDGYDFTLSNGTTYNYAGIKQAIAGYVYYWYRRNNATNTDATGGESASSSENATMQTVNQKIATVWNRMSREGRIMRDLLSQAVYADGDNAGASIYPEYGWGCGKSEVFRQITPFGL